MSNLFYIWDSRLHAVPQTVQQTNDMLEKFMADALALEEAGEEWEVERSDLLEDYVAELYDYWEQHELDEHNRPQFADGCEGVLIIEEGLMDEGQYYAAVQGAISRGLVFFHVDGGWTFLPDGRILPEEKQEGWEEFARKQVEEAKKPSATGQAFPRTEKEFGKRLYKALDPFIKKHGFIVETKEYFSIYRQTPFSLIKSSCSFNVNSLGANINLRFIVQYSKNCDLFYADNYLNGKIDFFSLIPLFFIYNNFFKNNENVEYYTGSNVLHISNKDVDVLEKIFIELLGFYEKYYSIVWDVVWLNQMANHSFFPLRVVSASPSIKLILASLNEDFCFKKLEQDIKKDKLIDFINDAVNPSPDQAAAEQKYAEYVEYVRNMKTVPWQLEEIPPEYQVKRPEGLLLVHELEVKLEEGQAYNTSFLLATDDPMQVVLKFISTDTGEAGVSVKGEPDGVHITFENWAYVPEFELPHPQVLGKTDDGRDFSMSYRIKTSHQLNSHRHTNREGRARGVSSFTTMSTTYQLLWQMFVAR